MRILSRYVLFRFLFWFSTVLALLLLVAATADLLIHFGGIRDVKSGGHPVVYLLMRLPALHFEYVIPVSAFAACLFTLGTASLGLEIIAAKAGGISPHRLVVPILVAALVLSFVTLLLNDTLVVAATRYVEKPNTSNEQTPEIVFKGGSFWYHSGRTIYNIRGADAKKATLRGVSVYERDERNRLVRSIHARSADIEDPQHWRFHDAIIRRFDPDRAASLPEFEHRRQILLEVEDDPEFGVLEADPSVLDLADLTRYIEARSREGENVTPYRSMLHRRLAAPFTVFLFALLAIPAALRAEQTRSLAAPALQGVVLIILFWFTDGFLNMLADSGVHQAVWSPWLLLAAFIAIGAVRVRRVPA